MTYYNRAREEEGQEQEDRAKAQADGLRSYSNGGQSRKDSQRILTRKGG